MKKLLPIALLALMFAACEDPVTPGDDSGNNTQPADTTGNQGSGSDEVDFTPEAWYETNFWDRTDREQAGLRGPVKQWRVTTYASYTLYEYDRAGHLLKASSYNNSGQLSEVVTNTYNAEGQLIKSESRAEDGYLYEEITYEYGNPGKVVVLDGYLYHGRLTSDMISYDIMNKDIMKGVSAVHRRQPEIQHTACSDDSYVFDEQGNLTIASHSYLIDEWNDGQIMDGTDTTLYYHWTYKEGYPDSSDHGISAMTWQANGMPLSWDSRVKETTYKWMGDYRVDHCEYYQNNRWLDIKDFRHVDGYVGSWLADYWRINEFNEHDELTHTQFDVYNEGGSIDYYYTDYVYDSHGNWISRKEDTMGVLDGNRSVSTVEREIIYY